MPGLLAPTSLRRGEAEDYCRSGNSCFGGTSAALAESTLCGIVPGIARSTGARTMPAEAEDDRPYKAQENRVRRALQRQGYALAKCRRRDPRAIGFGQYFIADQTNTVVAGGHITQGGFDLTLDDAERWAREGP
jgi:hypothetical protein